MSIRIITDSAADFTAAELKQHHITAVPLQVVFGEDAYADGVTLTHDIFWTRLTGGENPKTSQPSPEAFLSLFEDAKAAGDAVVCITLSSGLSGTMQSAMLARDMVDYDQVYIVDSRLAATGQKMLVLYACQLREEGRLSAAEMADVLTAFRTRIRLYACLDTLEYLARGGRIPKALASIGGVVRFKPLITLNAEGTIELCGKGIGMHRATEGLIKLVQKHAIDPRFIALPLYTYSPENCNAMIKKLNVAGVDCSEENNSAVGATISTHVGPGAYGLVFVEAE